MSKLTVFNHPLINHKLTMARDENTNMRDFRALVNEIGGLMAYEITRDSSQPNQILWIGGAGGQS